MMSSSSLRRNLRVWFSSLWKFPANLEKSCHGLRALPPNHLDWLNDDNVSERQASFLNMMVENGHANWCVLHAVILMFDMEPNLMEVLRVLTIASVARVASATYFLAMLEAFAEGGENVDKAISTFTRLFKAQKLHASWLHHAFYTRVIYTRAIPGYFYVDKAFYTRRFVLAFKLVLGLIYIFCTTCRTPCNAILHLNVLVSDTFVLCSLAALIY